MKKDDKQSELPLPEPDETVQASKIINPGFWGRMKAYFVAGVLVVAPISITAWLAISLVNAIDNFAVGIIPSKYHPETYLPFDVPGLGLLIVITGLTLIGGLTAGFMGRLFIRISEAILHKMPFIRSVYSATKQIMETVLANQSEAFRDVVLVQYPRKGIWAIGFITGRTEGEVQNLTEDTLMNVFVPTTPNPTSGFLLFFPKKDLHILEMSVEEGIKMVISGGIVTPPDPRSDKQKEKQGTIDS